MSTQIIKLTFKQFLKSYNVRLFDEEWDLNHTYRADYNKRGWFKYQTTCYKFNLDILYHWFKDNNITERYEECIKEVTCKDGCLFIDVADDLNTLFNDDDEIYMNKFEPVATLRTGDKYIIQFGPLSQLRYCIFLWRMKKNKKVRKNGEYLEKFLKDVQQEIDIKLKISRFHLNK